MIYRVVRDGHLVARALSGLLRRSLNCFDAWAFDKGMHQAFNEGDHAALFTSIGSLLILVDMERGGKDVPIVEGSTA